MTSDFATYKPVEGTILRWNYTNEELKQRTDDLISSSKKVYNTLASLKDEQLTCDTVIKALADDDSIFATIGTLVDFPQYVSADETVRETSCACDKLISAYTVECSMRVDVYERVNTFSQKEAEVEKLSAEGKRYLERLLRSYRRNGLHLDADTRETITEIKTKMSELGIDFSKNLNDVKAKLEFTSADLKGLPSDFIESLDKVEDSDDKYFLTLSYPHVFNVMKKCCVSETRKKMNIAFNSRCLEANTAILEELIALRHKLAGILGYETHADLITEIRMAGSKKAVSDFLSDLEQKLSPLAAQEMDKLLDLKKADCAETGTDFNGNINAWDTSYYQNLVQEKQFQVDHQALKEYFPLHKVTKGLLEIYQTLLGLKFTEVKDAHSWHKDVQLFRVDDNTPGSSELMGYFYLDLHPREGKYGHAACFGLQPGCIGTDGERQVPVAACVSNFTKPSATRPSLLLHSEVETYFHEFGHVMHNICARADYQMFAGTSVERDFVEAPSQMLENWCWEKESLRMMSEHYETKQPIPDEMIDSLVASKKANAGLLNKRQILLATFDQTIHRTASIDTAKTFHELSKRIWGVTQPPGTNMAASFGHLAGGYDAQYYGYMWSEVYSADMFSERFEKEGILNAKTGMDYRRSILQPGGTRDAMDSLVEFLGRAPTADAFLRSKGYEA
ncbi:thimet oligopeptidase [Sphaeroforma arctica JP610]|uniref:Thimet oligopeptidase n=1 Tax=Sphaeroforma arctica JP610 TaxID=667725 RepID=A0A0L0G707_9EUKA|nr:thimet oligopeptidase [Sphaeroforma arctica JP610]KNC84709.1 thimet oligopeptidase [Sphaeroforma arctica JP610]|eukprot:XP_014158611.1 thimet oligopeptidase [Sphaeroforma arctica JP610]